MSSFSRRGCFKCGNVGHYASVCTAPERLCYNCRQAGHESNLCPMPRMTDSKQCYSCGGVGHIQVDCPTLRLARNAGMRSGVGQCYNCGMPGHMARNCRNQSRYNQGGPHLRNFDGPANGHVPGRGGYLGGGPGRNHFNNVPNQSNNENEATGPGVSSNGRIICFKCGGLNHYSRDCRAKSVKCFNCNGFGHLSRDCSEPAKVQTCYKCQQEGHIARDCTQA
ncbi:cellular nucleic acid-binding protein [Entomortierella parvispora]|uniref:Cellular nucleic acid-binding protein n=1 Tax=Entomortierella parvispora TaxID=205924 RepID=A0A9P3M0J8_9FUNG|nr:cellular nucleic acid-binding protein [Entomortierella parvispora]